MALTITEAQDQKHFNANPKTWGKSPQDPLLATPKCFSAFVASANMLLRGRIWKLAQTLQSLFAIYTPIFSAVIGIPQNLFTLAPRALNPNVNVFNQHNTHYES